MKACLMCVRAQRALCPICYRALNSLCHMHSRAHRASCPTCSRVLLVSCFASSVPRMPRVLFVLVLHVPLNIGAHVSHVPCALCTLVLFESFFLRSPSVSYLVLYLLALVQPVKKLNNSSNKSATDTRHRSYKIRDAYDHIRLETSEISEG